MEFRTEHRIEALPDRIVDVFLDLDAWPEWVPNLVRVERVTEGPMRVGSEWRETRRIFGKEATEHFEVTEFDPPRSITMYVDGTKGSSKKGEYFFRYDLIPGDGSTTLALHARIESSGCLAAFLGRLFVGVFRKECVKEIEALKARVEEREA
jgi:carbon monoxide dehydrogenase subunit G